MNKQSLIFDASLQLFVANGFHGTATTKIAQTAGVATGTLFQYFKTKEELIIALFIHLKEELREFISKHTIDTPQIKEAIKSQMLSTLFWALDNPIKFRYIQQFHTSPYLGKVEKEVLYNQVESHLNLLKRGVDEGVLKPLDIEFLYTMISSQVFGLHEYISTKNLSKAEQHEIIERAFNMLWIMIT